MKVGFGPLMAGAPLSLDLPLRLRGDARTLILEPLPCFRSQVILPVNHMRVNLLRRQYRPVPEPRGHRWKWNAAGQQVRAVRVPQRVQARALRQLQAAE